MKKSTIRITITVAFVVLFWSAGAATAQTGCSKTTDEEIVRTIRQQFETDAEIKDQMRHVNVSVRKRVVTLEGWLNGKALVDKAKAMVRKTRCVKKVVSRLKNNGGGTCGPGLKPCGDTCIDVRSKCTIILDNQVQ
jgi:osmotically-inducible protein OsmY